MSRRMTILTIIMLTLIILSGCSTEEKPETVVSEFMDAMKKFDMEAMAEKINPKDSGSKEDITRFGQDEEEDFGEYFMDYIRDNAKKISYEITDTKIDGDKAVVSLKTKYVDAGPLFQASFGEAMVQSLGVAFSGKELTEEEGTELFVSIMKEKSEEIEESFAEKTLDIKCIKIDDQWYIDEPSDELLDVAMSNMVSVIDELEESFDMGEDSTVMEELDDEDTNIIEQNIGDEIELATIKIKVTEVEETDTLTSEYSDPVTARDGTKFVLVGMEMTNITKSTLDAPNTFILIDNEDREFTVYDDSMWAIDDYLDYRELAPSIKETGYFVYELPEDAINYYIVMGKAETNDIYKIILK